GDSLCGRIRLHEGALVEGKRVSQHVSTATGAFFNSRTRLLHEFSGLGAEGVQLGTRMVASAESPVHENWKKSITEASETDTIFLNRRFGPGLRALRTEHTEALEYSDRNVISELGKAMELYFGGDMNASIALTGQVAGRIDEIRPVAEVLNEIVGEFFEVTAELGRRYPAS
ncbi:MAG: hypothetical protein GY937_15700, partial [bacterium]|nr:hypothetical protein [bacterium]